MHTSSPRPALVAPLILAGAVLAVVIGAGFAIVGHPDWSVAEDQAIRAVQSVGGAGLELVAGAIGIGFGPAGAILVVLIVLAVAYLRTRSWRLTARTAIVIAVPWAVAEAIKDIVRRPRPDPALLGQAATTPLTYSFPSGHTAFAAALGLRRDPAARNRACPRGRGGDRRGGRASDRLVAHLPRRALPDRCDRLDDPRAGARRGRRPGGRAHPPARRRRSSDAPAGRRAVTHARDGRIFLTGAASRARGGRPDGIRTMTGDRPRLLLAEDDPSSAP
ncbi:phosphatase PAP2 family protein [Microbacterium elymi]|uniref:phosphatase PAP2 family protein n=1 Tax=Microbacterium elymi TaxID=2909587 RepID=UPI003F497734